MTLQISISQSVLHHTRNERSLSFPDRLAATNEQLVFTCRRLRGDKLMANARNSIVLPQIGYFINSMFQVIEASGSL